MANDQKTAAANSVGLAATLKATALPIHALADERLISEMITAGLGKIETASVVVAGFNSCI